MLLPLLLLLMSCLPCSRVFFALIFVSFFATTSPEFSRSFFSCLPVSAYCILCRRVLYPSISGSSVSQSFCNRSRSARKVEARLSPVTGSPFLTTPPPGGGRGVQPGRLEKGCWPEKGTLFLGRSMGGRGVFPGLEKGCWLDWTPPPRVRGGTPPLERPCPGRTDGRTVGLL